MTDETITTRILVTQRERIGKLLGNPQKIPTEKYVQTALEEKLVKDEKKTRC